MSKAKSSAKVSATATTAATATTEVTMSAQVETTAVETTAVETAEVHAKGVASGERAKMIAQIMAKIEDGSLQFAAESETRKVAISPKGSRVILEIVEKEGDKRAKHAGKSVTCVAWSEKDIVVGEGEDAKTQVQRSIKVNGKDIWLKVDPEYKFPTLNGAFVSNGTRKPRQSSGKKAPAVVHSIDDML